MTDLNTIAPVALLAGAAALWTQIRGFLDRVRALFVQRTILNGPVAEMTANYLLQHARIIQWGDRFIQSDTTWVRPLDAVAEVAYETPAVQPRLAFLNGRPMLLSALVGHGDMPSNGARTIILTTLRGTLPIEEITKAALEDARKLQTSGQRFRVRRIGGKRDAREHNSITAPGELRGSPPSSGNLTPASKLLHWSPADIGAPKPPAPFAALALCQHGERARADFKRWLGLKQWYKDRGIPWRRGHLYYGPPGTGKTSLARALAQEADMPIYAFDLSTLDNEQFGVAWLDMQESTPCMALIEDIDGTFHGRINIRAQDNPRALTFDCFLNALGGVQTADGVFVVITTNKPDELDEALGQPRPDGSTSRPGRLDRAYCLELPGVLQRTAILYRIAGDIGDGIDATEGMSAAQVTEYAIARALEATWKPESAS